MEERRGLPFEDWEIDLIKRNYQQLSHQEIGLVIQRSEGSVRNFCYEHGLRKRAEYWTDGEVAILKSEYKNEHPDLDLLEKRLDRDKTNICRKAREMGLTDQNRAKSPEHAAQISGNAKRRIEENGHPRGFLGHTHSDDARQKIAISSKQNWDDPDFHLNSDEYRQELSDRMTEMQKNGKRRQSYSRGSQGKREDLGGLYVRSSWEANYARYLNLLQKLGEIAKWEYESDRFEFAKIKRGTRSYLPDFKVWTKDGKIEYHEVKGWMTQKGRTALKRMAKYYPDVTVILIDKVPYYQIQRGFASLIPEWEFRDKKK